MEEGIMMQPLDVKTQKFKKGLFGYKAVDVDEFVSTVGSSYEELLIITVYYERECIYE